MNSIKFKVSSLSQWAKKSGKKCNRLKSRVFEKFSNETAPKGPLRSEEFFSKTLILAFDVCNRATILTHILFIPICLHFLFVYNFSGPGYKAPEAAEWNKYKDDLKKKRKRKLQGTYSDLTKAAPAYSNGLQKIGVQSTG